MPESIIPFLPDFEVKDLTTIEFKRTTTENGDTETVKYKLYKISEDTTHRCLLHCIFTFNKARVPLGWTTGRKLYPKFKDLLDSLDDETWWEEYFNENQLTENVNNFNL